jgi:hypothetical protein
MDLFLPETLRVCRIENVEQMAMRTNPFQVREGERLFSLSVTAVEIVGMMTQLKKPQLMSLLTVTSAAAAAVTRATEPSLT